MAWLGGLADFIVVIGVNPGVLLLGLTRIGNRPVGGDQVGTAAATSEIVFKIEDLILYISGRKTNQITLFAP